MVLRGSLGGRRGTVFLTIGSGIDDSLFHLRIYYRCRTSYQAYLTSTMLQTKYYIDEQTAPSSPLDINHAGFGNVG